jgi:G3E family GTPase
MTLQKIPIYLLTGFLGSGKTTLLKEWLHQPEFKDAALIINELGEVGIDQALLTHAAEAASLVANACVCCTGLPGLSQALEDLFWARLERRVHKFPLLIIETTGLAMPGPILETLAQNSLLMERYEWAGTLTCVSANAYQAVMHDFKEAQDQLTQADVCILTKTDLLDETGRELARMHVQEFFAHHDLTTPLLSSQLASLSAHDVLQALASIKESSLRKANDKDPLSTSQETQSSLHLRASCEDAHQHDLQEVHAHDHEHSHHHHAQTHFWPMAEHLALEHSLLQVQALKQALGSDLLRVKGMILSREGAHLIQMSPFDTQATVSSYEAPQDLRNKNATQPPWGLTLIVNSHMHAQRRQAMRDLLGFLP